MKRAALLAFAVSLASLFVAPGEAEAQGSDYILESPHSGSRPVTLDIHVGPSWFGVGLATGVRLGIPLVKNGFIGHINNSVYLSLGADFYFIRYWQWQPASGRSERVYGPGFGFPVALHWEFYFTKMWSAFGEIGANVFIGPWVFDDDAADDFAPYPGAWILFAVGGKLHISENFALVLRLGTPYASFGMSLSF